MDLFLNIFDAAFDLFIVMSYLNNVLLKRKENISKLLFFSCYVLMEIVSTISSTLTLYLPEEQKSLMNILRSILLLLALTFLYEATLLRRLFYAVSFQLLAILGEYLFTMLMSLIHPDIFNLPIEILQPIMFFGSTIFLFFLTLLFCFFWQKKFREQTPSYSLLLFSTPVITLTILYFIPYHNYAFIKSTPLFCIITCVSFALLNVINYLLLENMSRQEQAMQKMKEMETQITFQKEKYQQLGTAYKTNRRLIHDTKKHYFTIQEYIKQEKYDLLTEYMKNAMDDIEHSYIGVNSGNLVIDAFVSNFENLSKNNGITMSSNIHLDPKRIPTTDYELCIILGNILDNSYNACIQNAGEQNKINLTISINESDYFYIRIENTYRQTDTARALQNPDFLEHGYGIENIAKIVNQKLGFLKYDFEELFSMDIAIPIIDEKKRFHPPVKHKPRLQ